MTRATLLLLFVALPAQAGSMQGGSVFRTATSARGGSMAAVSRINPALAITSHVDNDNVAALVATVTGTAVDAGVITCSVDTGGACSCSGTSSWSCSATMSPGTDNVVTVTHDLGPTAQVTLDQHRPFYAPFTTSGIANLPATLGNTGATVFLDCDARDVSGVNWACDTGGTFSEAGSGSSPVSGKAVPFTESGARGVDMGGTTYKHYANGSTSAADITTEDFAVEIVYKLNAASTNLYLLEKNDGTAGWAMREDGGTGGITLALTTGAAVTTVTSPSNTVGSWAYAICFVDRDEASATDGSRCYMNGNNMDTGVDMSARSGSLTNASAASVGKASSNADVTIAHFRAWKCAGCFAGSTNDTDWGVIAADRFARLTGVYPTIAKGAAVPTTMTRTSIAHVDIDRDEDGARRLFVVGSGWPRVAKRKELSGGEWLAGYLSEQQSTNLVEYSRDLSQTAWTKGAASISGSTVTTPLGSGAVAGVIGDATANSHQVYNATSLTTGVTYTISAFLRSGDKPAAALAMSSNCSVAGGSGVRVDISSCALGPSFGSATAIAAEQYTADDGTTWCRGSFSFPSTLTSAFCNTTIVACDDAVSDCTFTGDASTINIYVADVQTETGGVASSPILTGAATATRNEDTLAFDDADNANMSTGTMQVSLLTPNWDNDATRVALLSLNDGTANNRSALALSSADDCIHNVTLAAAAQSAVQGGTNLSNGEIRTCRGTWATDDFKLYVDGVSVGTPDTSGSSPSNATITKITIGNSGAGAGNLVGLVSEVSIYDEVVTP